MPPSRAARRRPRGRGTPGRRTASPPSRASSRMSPAPPGRNGAAATCALLVSGRRSLENAEPAERPVADARDADHPVARLGPPDAGVLGDAAIVAEHEVVALRDELAGQVARGLPVGVRLVQPDRLLALVLHPHVPALR